jgi:hypothetical protein
MFHAGRDNAQAGFFEATVYFAKYVFGNCVGFDDGKSAFDRHRGISWAEKCCE